MSDNVKYYILYTILYGIILLLGEVLYRHFKMNSALSRNFSHITAGIVSLPYPWLFNSHWWILLIAVQSSLILFITRSSGFFPSHHKIAGKGMGSILFFVSLYICFFVSYHTGNRYLFVLPILVLTISDTTASIIGRRFGKRPITILRWTGIKNKTNAGTIAFFVSSIVIVFLVYQYYLGGSFLHIILMSLLISLATSLSEAISPNGSDNFSIPITAMIIMWLGMLL